MNGQDLEPLEVIQLQNEAQRIVHRRASGLLREDREDILQEVLARYFARFANTAPHNREAWFETTTANLVTDRLRALGRKPPEAHAPYDGDLDQLVREWSGFYCSLEVTEPATLEAIFGLIPDQEAHLLRAVIGRGLTATDMAEVIGVPANTLHQRVSRAKKRLREALEARPDLVEELRAGHPHSYPDQRGSDIRSIPSH